MNEEEWNTTHDLERMLETVRQTLSSRKVRLFAIACVRPCWYLLRDDRLRKAVDTAEKFSDQLVGPEELQAAYLAGQEALAANNYIYSMMAARTAAPDPWDAAMLTCIPRELDKGRLAAKLREVVGNPFRSIPRRDFYPSEVQSLARALYEGENVAFALRDALLDSGEEYLSSHFSGSQETQMWFDPVHPRGCWVLDIILGYE